MSNHTIERRVEIAVPAHLLMALYKSSLIDNEIVERISDAERDTTQACIDWEHGPAEWKFEIVCTATITDISDEY